MNRSVEDSPSGCQDEARRRSLLPVLLPILAVSLVALAAVAIPLPYYAVGPGTVEPVAELIEVPADEAFPPSGEIALTTVSLRTVTPFFAFLGWLDDDVDVVPAPRLLGSGPGKITREEFTRESERSMEVSREVAVLAALDYLDLPVQERGTGAVVRAVVAGAPAEGVLTVGDVIVALAGTPTTTAPEAVNVLASHRPGAAVALEVLGPNGSQRTEEVRLGAHPDRPGSPFLGVSLETKDRELDLPVDVRINRSDVGGASAGLAFALGVVDVLTPGEITAGRKIAVTGTITPDGRVGPIDGMAQKAAAARAAGAEYLLVPPANRKEAVVAAGKKVRVVAVSSLDEAVAALVRFGGEAGPTG